MKLPKLTIKEILLSVPIIGAAAFYGWGPFSDYFLTGNYDENVMLAIETETIKLDDEQQLLTIHLKPANRGNVPVELRKEGKKGSLVLEVRKVENPENLKWINPDQLELVNKIDVLEKYKDGYLIEPNAYYDEIEAIKIPNGIYWIKAILTFKDGDIIDQSYVTKVSNEPNQ